MNLLETGKLIGHSEEELKIGLGEATLFPPVDCGNDDSKHLLIKLCHCVRLKGAWQSP
jgi:hypothetical protein